MLDELRNLSHNFLKMKNSSYRRYFIKTDPFKHRLSLLLGQRGIGKTTTLVQYLLDKSSQNYYDKSILYIQADHFLVGTSSLYSIAEEFYLLGGKFLAFDEIHKYQNWSQELKSIYDTFPKLTVVASGSSALQMYKGSHDLVRRAIKHYMVGLSFREFLELHENLNFNIYSLDEILNNHLQISSTIFDILEGKNLKILPMFQKYLSCGYYPYFFEMPNEEFYFITVEQNLRSTIEVDLAAIYPHLSGSSLSKLKQLLIYISQEVPFTPNLTTIKNILEIGDIRTLKTYFRYLEDAALIRSLSKKYQKLDHLTHPEKIYLDNPNQMRALSFGKTCSGSERELFFFNMLSLNHKVTLPSKGDFLVDEQYLFEVGGKNKAFNQIAKEKTAYVASDNIESGVGNKIPLWLFGFLY